MIALDNPPLRPSQEGKSFRLLFFRKLALDGNFGAATGSAVGDVGHTGLHVDAEPKAQGDFADFGPIYTSD